MENIDVNLKIEVFLNDSKEFRELIPVIEALEANNKVELTIHYQSLVNFELLNE
jgi:carbon monoxide dehydrogenase subunit G